MYFFRSASETVSSDGLNEKEYIHNLLEITLRGLTTINVVGFIKFVAVRTRASHGSYYEHFMFEVVDR